MKYTQARELVEAALHIMEKGDEPSIEHDTSAFNIEAFGEHLNRLKKLIAKHQNKKQMGKVKKLSNLHTELEAKQKKAMANHAAGNYAANRTHHVGNHPELKLDWS
jgi:hypothetical protein